MRVKWLRFCLLFVLFLSTSFALAQSTEQTLQYGAIASGGGTARNDDFRLSGTAGQSYTGRLQGGEFTLTSGFWQPQEMDINRVLAIYALALDNRPTSPGNLSGYYPAAIQAIIDATVIDPEKIAVVLADRDGDRDSQIFVIQNGRRLPITKNSECPFTPQVEYNMTDGESLGNFIRWAKCAYPATKSYFSFVGHGLPLTPATDINEIFKESAAVRSAGEGNDKYPIVPTHRYSHPDLTDYRPRGLISPYELWRALDIGTYSGEDPLTVLDLTHCFAASVEEFYEISNPNGAPLARVMVGSPNYTYFAPQLLNRILVALQPNQTIEQMANAVIGAYEQVINAADESLGAGELSPHPRILVAVDSEKIPPIKDKIDEVASALNPTWNSATETRVRNAYTASQKYDTTYCYPQDWDLLPPDGLSDVGHFFSQLAQQFEVGSTIRQRAEEVVTLAAAAIITSTRKPGVPWFGNPHSGKPWKFEGVGLSIYTDFAGAQNDVGETLYSWQAHWYTDGTRDKPNPHPYAFVQKRTTDATWADIARHFWGEGELKTQACLPEFPPVIYDGELRLEQILFPLKRPGMLSENVPSQLAVAVRTEKLATNALVEFKVTNPDGAVIFTDTVSAGTMITGVHQVKSERSFSPSLAGDGYTIMARVDPDGRFKERNENDNIYQDTFNIANAFDRPTITATFGLHWVKEDAVTVGLTQDFGTDKITGVEVIMYQYNEADGSPLSQVADVVNPKVQNTNIFSVTLPQSLTIPLSYWPLRPGAVEMHIWGKRGSNPSKFPGIVNFNYTPPRTPIEPGIMQYYLFEASPGDEIAIDLEMFDNGNMDANIFIWYPDSYWGADLGGVAKGNDKIKFSIPFLGQYVVGIRGETKAEYNLKAAHTHKPSSHAVAVYNENFYDVDDEGENLPSYRPTFLPPIPQSPSVFLYFPVITDGAISSMPDAPLSSGDAYGIWLPYIGD